MPTDFLKDTELEDATLKAFPTCLKSETAFEAVTDIDRKRVFRMAIETLPTEAIEIIFPILRLPERTIEAVAWRVFRITFVFESETTPDRELDSDLDIDRTMLTTEADEAESITERVLSLVVVAKDEAEAERVFPALLTNDVVVVAVAVIVLIIIFNGAIVATEDIAAAKDLLISFMIEGFPAIDALRVLKNDLMNEIVTTPIDVALKVFPALRAIEAVPEKVVLIARMIILSGLTTGEATIAAESVL